MKTAKQWIALILALAMAANLVGCGVSGKDDTAQSQQSAVQNAVNDPTDDDRTDAGPADSDTADGVQLDDAQTAADGEGAETDADTAADSAAAGQQTAAKDQYVVVETPNATTPDTGADTVPDAPQQGDQSANTSPVAPDGEYNKGVVLVKVKESFDPAALGTLAYTSAEPLYKGSKWYTVTLTDAEQTVEAVTYLTGLAVFESVDYDYVMSTDTAGQSVDVSCNPDYGKHKHHHTHKVPDVWQDAVDNGKNPGGSADVVVAVIDTGVDYNHLDLRNNIWINTAEIAGNGKDDDGNGYVDDVRGWDFVGNDKDPMDDNGHGTHVAGIIAAENNELGGVGIAYNCKIMVLKAGNSSGYFNNSDIAEAVQYAYMNGASVINMSFGGSLISLPVEEALEGAYNSCVLVAAAGNSSLCNNTACRTCDAVGVSYPAALP